MHADKVVSGVGHADFLEQIAPRLQIGARPAAKLCKKSVNRKNNGAAFDDMVDEGQSRRTVGPRMFGFEEQHSLISRKI